MVGVRLSLLIFTCFLLLSRPRWLCSAASGKPLCHEEERSSLLGFKNSFFNETNCFSSYSSPWKMVSWKDEVGKSGDCCDWGGVTCNDVDGHVMGLDLSASCLAGRIDSNASIFDLVHLQELNLAWNSFDQSPIPTTMGRLTRLTKLNLSSSSFGSEVVPKMMSLLNLSSLDLSGNQEMSISSLEELLLSLNKIEELHLSWVTVSDSQVPRSLGNVTSLRSLMLSGCSLSGEFPDSVFGLPRLEFLDVSLNNGLTGHLTGFHRGSPIKSLELYQTNFTGELPVWLGNLTSLAEVDISYCGFSGKIPPSICDLKKLMHLDLTANNFGGPIPSCFGNLTNLEVLSLTSNRLSAEIPSSLGNLINLVRLDLRYNQLRGGIHSSLGNLTGVEWLYLHSNQLTSGIPTSLMQLPRLSTLDIGSNLLTGNVPSRISNLTSLTNLDLSGNRLHGPLPDAIYQLGNLSVIRLGSNYLTGLAHLDMVLELKGVTEIDLSSNAFSSIIFPKPNANVSQISVLDLGSSNLIEVPRFLKHQQALAELSLSNNKISAQIPEWLLEGIVGTLDLSFNYFHGTLPIPPYSIGYYRLSNNRLSGEIPSSFCDLEGLDVLDLADNDFTGVLPTCFGNFSATLRALSLSGNNFGGKIPEFNHKPCSRLFMMDLSSNLFEGPLPRSLTNCSRLEYVNFGRNKIADTFPSWLGRLPWLKVLMLHSNRFHGVMMAPRNDSLFLSLKVITLSQNNLWGRLPADYFAHLPAMKYFSRDDELVDPFVKMITMTIMDKGIEREFGKTLGYFTLVDLSNNNFSGTIPESIGDNLLKLHTLNLSNNDLSGSIPLSLANLRNLEVMDLSRNRLSGEIPALLTRITFLNHFNVSYNNLSGSIPGGNQFISFDNTSYMGNPGLCGAPLTKKCSYSPQSRPSPAPNQEEKSSQSLGIVWITALAGLAGGLVVGVTLELAFGADVVCWLERNWRKHFLTHFK